jgi:hypothetical protein
VDPFKYPRTPHLPWSPGATGDDVYLNDTINFVGQEVVVTEKLDGENCAMYWDDIHARSLDGRDHPSRGYVKQLHGRVRWDIPVAFRLAGENCYAEHSIPYTALPDWFLLFGIYQQMVDQVLCLSWDSTVEWAALLDLKTVPVLYRGIWDEERVRACWTGVSRCGGAQEGYVVRLASSFTIRVERNVGVFSDSIAKYVRKDHIQTDEHWMSKPVVVNGLAR